MHTRSTAVAGSFYPGNSRQLNSQVAELLSGATTKSAPLPKALIVPHAGYLYSGKTAAAAYRLLSAHKSRIKTVVLIGPSHRFPFHGIATTSATQFATPLANICIDRQSIASLLEQGLVVELDDAHRLEHSLEVQLPFLQVVLDTFKLVPLATGACTVSDVSKVLQHFQHSTETLVVISSDLSHFHPYDTARSIDLDTCQRILQGETRINPEQACGCMGINGLNAFIHKTNLRLELLEYTNSGDTAGDKHRVVGYGAFAAYEQ